MGFFSKIVLCLISGAILVFLLYFTFFSKPNVDLKGVVYLDGEEGYYTLKKDEKGLFTEDTLESLKAQFSSGTILHEKISPL